MVRTLRSLAITNTRFVLLITAFLLSSFENQGQSLKSLNGSAFDCALTANSEDSVKIPVTVELIFLLH